MLSAHNNFNASGRGCEIVCSATFWNGVQNNSEDKLLEEEIPLILPMKPDNWSEFSLVCGEFSIIVKASSELEAAKRRH